MDQARFNHVKKKYGSYASWAVWADEGAKPKDNVGDLSIFDENTSSILDTINPNLVLVGLNVSGEITDARPFANFHSPAARGQDYKLRYALKGTALWGAYITDLIKDHPEVSSTKVSMFLKDNPDIVERNVKSLIDEVMDVGATKPVFFALGGETFKLLLPYVRNRFKLIKITHYAHYISREEYRANVVEALERIGL